MNFNLTCAKPGWQNVNTPPKGYKKPTPHPSGCKTSEL
jgi:hypothetical protein